PLARLGEGIERHLHLRAMELRILVEDLLEQRLRGVHLLAALIGERGVVERLVEVLVALLLRRVEEHLGHGRARRVVPVAGLVVLPQGLEGGLELVRSGLRPLVAGAVRGPAARRLGLWALVAAAAPDRPCQEEGAGDQAARLHDRSFTSSSPCPWQPAWQPAW